MNKSTRPSDNEVAWCKKHPTGYLGKDQFGNWYPQCWTGKKHNEKCEIIIEAKDKSYLIH